MSQQLPEPKSHLKAIKNYVPGKPLEELEREYGIRNALKLASNENALGPSPKALSAARKALSRSHRYPEGGCHFLREALSKHLKVQPDTLVFGNGSDEILVFAARTYAGEGDEVITSNPTFLIYEIASCAEKASVVKIPMKNFHYDLDAMRNAVNQRTKIIFIANPDNPVGTYVGEEALTRFLKVVPSRVLVVLDEAYYEFARAQRGYPDSIGLLKRFPNLVVTRTFSKAYGLAGMRVGYGIASAEVAGALNKVREPFNVNLLAQAAAVAALQDVSHLKRSVQVVCEGRELLQESLKNMGFDVVPTATNFILFDLGVEAQPVYEKLLRQGVIVRPMGGWGMKTFLRVTIGKPAENKRFLEALKKSVD